MNGRIGRQGMHSVSAWVTRSHEAHACPPRCVEVMVWAPCVAMSGQTLPWPNQQSKLISGQVPVNLGHRARRASYSSATDAMRQRGARGFKPRVCSALPGRQV